MKQLNQERRKDFWSGPAVQADRICKQNHQIRSAPGSILPSFAAKILPFVFGAAYIMLTTTTRDLTVTVPCPSWSAIAMRALTSLQASFTPTLRFGRPFANLGLGVCYIALYSRRYAYPVRS